MQTYLKSRPIGIQFLLFVGMAAGIMMVVSLIGSVILAQVTGASLLQMADPKSWKPGDGNTLALLRGMLLLQFLGLFLIPSLLYAYFADPQPGQYLGMRPPHNNFYWLMGIAALLLSVPLVEYTGYLNKHIPFPSGTKSWMQGMEEQAGQTIQYMLGNSSISNLLLNLIFIAVFAGLGEELLFRGVIQRFAIQATKSPWAGIIIAAFLFSFFHLQFFGFVPRFLLGIVLGAIYWYSGSIWPAVVAHFVYDAFFIVLAHFNPALIADPNASLVAPNSLPIMAVLSAAVVSGLVWAMMRMSKTTYDYMMREETPTVHVENDSEAWR